MRTHMKTNTAVVLRAQRAGECGGPRLVADGAGFNTGSGAQRPAPEPARLPDGKPNWTGFWDLPNGFLEAYRGPAGVSGPNRGGGRGGGARNGCASTSLSVRTDYS